MPATDIPSADNAADFKTILAEYEAKYYTYCSDPEDLRVMPIEARAIIVYSEALVFYLRELAKLLEVGETSVAIEALKMVVNVLTTRMNNTLSDDSKLIITDIVTSHMEIWLFFDKKINLDLDCAENLYFDRVK